MSAPTDQEINEAIEVAYHSRPGFGGTHGTPPELSLESAISDWWSLVMGHAGLWERWPCGDEKCPARPAYDDAISKLSNELGLVQEACADLIRGRFAEMAVRIRDQYPDAPRVSTKPELVAGTGSITSRNGT